MINDFAFEGMCTTASDGEELGNGGFRFPLAPDAIQPLPQRFGDGARHGLAGFLR